MTKYKVISTVTHDGETYQPGDQFDAGQDLARELIAAGVLRDPNEVTAEEQSIKDAESQAQRIVAEAEKQAAKILNEAKSEASKVKPVEAPNKPAAK